MTIPKGSSKDEGLIWEDLDPEKMRLLEKTDPKERNKLVVRKCNVIEFTNWPIRGQEEKHNLHGGLLHLDKTFEPGDQKEKYTKEPGDEVNPEEANK